jgi:hypothetical protein
MLKKAVLVAVGVAAVMGFKFWSKIRDKADARERLTQICADDKACLSALDQHFEACFAEAYSLGGRRRAASLNNDKFLSCFNTKAGSEVFSFKANE